MTDALIIIAKALFYGGSLVGIGVGTHYASGIETGRAWLWVGVGVALIGLLIRLLGLNLEIVGDLHRWLDFSMFGWVWPGVRAQVIAILIGLSLLALSAGLQRRWIALMGAISLAIAFGASGHAHADGMPSGLGRFVMVHVLIAGFWFVAPFTLWSIASRGSEAQIRRLKTFSRIATLSIPLMVLAGLWLAYVIAGGIPALFGSTYGRLLLGKFALILFAIGLGAFNKFRLTQQIEAGVPSAARTLKRSLTVEFILFVAALFLVAAATTLFGPHS